MVPHNSLDDLEKLIQIAQKSKQEKTLNPEVQSFIDALSIKTGKALVPTYMIYYHYSIWAKKPLSRVVFFRNFKTKFDRVRTNGEICYRLDPKPFDLSSRQFFKARSLMRRDYNDRKKTKTK